MLKISMEKLRRFSAQVIVVFEQRHGCGAQCRIQQNGFKQQKCVVFKKRLF